MRGPAGEDLSGFGVGTAVEPSLLRVLFAVNLIFHGANDFVGGGSGASGSGSGPSSSGNSSGRSSLYGIVRNRKPVSFRIAKVTRVLGS
jgi:hypothetical protein